MTIYKEKRHRKMKKKVSQRFSLRSPDGERCGRTLEMEEELGPQGDPDGSPSPAGDCN